MDPKSNDAGLLYGIGGGALFVIFVTAASPHGKFKPVEAEICNNAAAAMNKYLSQKNDYTWARSAHCEERNGQSTLTIDYD